MADPDLMGDDEVFIDAGTRIEVGVPPDDDMVQVSLGAGPGDVTFLGELADVHRLFIEIDNRISRLVTRNPSG
ncbi:MAG: hypothetical protein OEV40_21465 [Acidimicrobiia bacterium]|nr:hypothetical protein [Acidimicrobiia bacterium]